MRPSSCLAFGALVLFAGVEAGCVILNPDPSARTDLTGAVPPGGTAFKPVAKFLGNSCGTLDCHGQVGRNLRIYSPEGLRLSPMDQSGGALKLITSDEVDADYRSAVALEPEITAAVWAGEAPPEALTLVRKPRAMEHHKGGQVVFIGDDRDNCLTSWLTGTTDTTACANAIDPSLYP